MSGLDVDLLVERRTAGGSRFVLEMTETFGPGFTVVCGASGGGKTTLLMAVLGALRPSRGTIRLDGRTLFDSAGGVDLETRRRGIGMVFQDAPLFPHLDVAGNVAFALRGAERDARARVWLERVAAADLAARSVGELSGGQRQRVALARALAAGPAALLLDEPFSALDARARTSLGRLLVELQTASGIPFVHVTHDLNEALHLGTRLVLLDAGRVAQSGPPAQVLARPASVAAAHAVGTENLLGGTVLAHRDELGCTEVDLDGTRVVMLKLDLVPGDRVTLGLRAEEILLSLKPIHETSARNVIAGTVEQIGSQGAGVELRVATPTPFRVVVTRATVRELGLEAGTPVWLLIKATAFHRLF